MQPSLHLSTLHHLSIYICTSMETYYFLFPFSLLSAEYKGDEPLQSFPRLFSLFVILTSFLV
jgi:hypothetical protein